MNAKRDYYDILGVEKAADASEIKKAYRKLAKKYHPDTNSGNASAEGKFKEINEAYEILGNKEKRALYDKYGAIAFEPGFSPEAAENQYSSGFYHSDGAGAGFGFGGKGAGFGFGAQSAGFDFSKQNAGESEVFWGDILDELFKNGSFHSGASAKNPVKGSDAEAEITVSFDEAALGCDKMISLQNAHTGDVQSLHVHIPAGVDTGSRIRLKGKGEPGPDKNKNGDLYLNVTVAKKPGYERRGRDIYTSIHIPYATAVLGGKVRIRTLYGDVMCSIKEGTQSGSKIRIKGKGIVSMKDPSVYGDLYVTVQVQVPTNLSPDAKQKLREFQKASGF